MNDSVPVLYLKYTLNTLHFFSLKNNSEMNFIHQRIKTISLPVFSVVIINSCSLIDLLVPLSITL